MRIETIVGSKTYKGAEGLAIRLEASRAMAAAQERHLRERRCRRLAAAPERDSVARAIYAVENRIVRAFWVLARLPDTTKIGFSSRHGVNYIHDRTEQFANAVAQGGWDLVRPKPAIPSSRAIDEMYEALDWLKWLDTIDARLVSAGTATKQGNVEHNVSWRRVRIHVPELADMSTRSLQWRYRNALRALVSELTFRRMANRD